MADNLTFDINAKDNASATLAKVSKNLQKMQKNVDETASAFGSLKRVIGGLAFTALIGNTLKFADSIDDVSKATGIAIANVVAFGQAVQANGGTMEDATNAMNTLILSIGEAANGSIQAQQAFAEVGVTLSDLETLSQQEIFNKVIQGLGEITDKSQQARISNELLRKTLRGTDITNVASDYASGVKAAGPYAQSIQTAAKAQENLQKTIFNLQVAILDLLSPLTQIAASITLSSEAIKSLIKSVILLVGAFKLLKIAANKALFDSIVAGVKNLPALFTSVSGALLNVIKDLKGFANMWTRIVTGASSAASIFGAIGGSLAVIGRFAVGFLGIFGAIIGAFELLKFLNESAFQIKWIKDFTDYVDKLLGKIPLIGKFLGTVETPKAAAATETEADKAKKQRDIEKAQALTKLGNEIRNVTKAYQENNDQLIQNIRDDAKYLQMSEDTVEVIKAQEEIYNRAINAITELQNKKQNLTKEEQSLKPIIDEQIAAIEKSITVDQIRAEQAITNLQNIRKAQEDLLKSIEDANRALQQNEALAQLQEELDLVGLYGDELEKQQRINEINRDLRQQMIALSTDLLKLEADRTRLGEESYNKERQRIAQQMQDAQDLANAKIEAYNEQKKRETEIEESYVEGIKRGLDDMAEQYKPINIAQDAVKKGFDAIGDAVDKFVETGKFKFSDFARSVIADIAKMIIKAQLLKAIGNVFGAFGFSIPGLAEGGPVKGGQPYIVGEKGPELFVPPGAGRIVPNDELGRGKSTGMVNAPVTNNYITNNINALDAKSVAELFAANRKTLLGTVKMAERELPYMA